MELSTINTTMSSREIAELTGKQHKDVLEAVRKMEVAWEKVTGRNFTLSEYRDSTGRKLPMYNLTKTETLYIATKFNDEARARLILRWQELEQERSNPLLNSTTLLALTTQLKKERDQLSEDLVKLEARADNLEVIEQFILKAVGQNSLISHQNYNVKESWESIFIENYGEPTKVYIDKYFDEWVDRKEIPVREFNDTYKFKKLPLRTLLQAIFQYCARNKIHFIKNKVIKKDGESLRVRMFNKK